jgi:hypothetical protein
MGSFHLLHLKKFYPRFKRGLCDEASMTMPSPQERLVGERMVVKEIEIFGDFRSAKVGEDLARIIHDGSSRNGGVARDEREERDSRDV